MTNFLMCLVTSLLLVFSFPNFIQKGVHVSTAIFMWLAFVPLFIVIIKEEKKKNVFLYGFLAAIVFYLAALYWMWFIGPMGAFAYVAWFLLCVHLSLFIACSLVIAKALKEEAGLDYLLSLPVIITVAEYVREWLFTGFPLLTPAQSQHQFYFILKILKVTGVHGLNYLIIFVNAAITLFIINRRVDIKKPGNMAATMIALCLVLFAAAGSLPQKKGEITVKTAVMQRNIDQNTTWNAAYKKKVSLANAKLLSMIKNEAPDIILWPETGYPGVLDLDPGAPANFARISFNRSYNLVGSDSIRLVRGRRRYYNSVFLVTPEGRINGDYSKYHLVPFGEYVPLQEVFPLVDKVVRRYGYESFSRGRKIEPLDMGGIKFGVLICYDSLFPEISREFAKKGARFLAHLSYESWYGNTQASAQIFTNTVLRAVENDIYLARSVEAGISGIVDNEGRIIKETKLFTEGVVISEIKIKSSDARTLYTRFGDWFIFFLLLVTAPFVSVRLWKKQY